MGKITVQMNQFVQYSQNLVEETCEYECME